MQSLHCYVTDGTTVTTTSWTVVINHHRELTGAVLLIGSYFQLAVVTIYQSRTVSDTSVILPFVSHMSEYAKHMERAQQTWLIVSTDH